MALLGRFNDDLTRVFDDTYGTQWAEIEEMLAIATIATEPALTTRRLAAITRLNRRAISRLVARMRADDLITSRPSDFDRRAVEIVFTAHGTRRLEGLRARIEDFFVHSTEMAEEISTGLGLVSTSAQDIDGHSPAATLDLLRRVCEAGLALVRTMPDAARDGRLAARQRAALVHIAMTGGARPHELTTALGVTRSSVAYIVDQLCAKGFATRRRAAVPEDRRAVVVEATADGVRAVHAVMAGIEQQRESLARLFGELARWSPRR